MCKAKRILIVMMAVMMLCPQAVTPVAAKTPDTVTAAVSVNEKKPNAPAKVSTSTEYKVNSTAIKINIDTVKWSKVKRAKGYRIYRRAFNTCGNDRGKWKLVKTVSANTRSVRLQRQQIAMLPSVLGGYFEGVEYAVCAYNNAGNSVKKAAGKVYKNYFTRPW